MTSVRTKGSLTFAAWVAKSDNLRLRPSPTSALCGGSTLVEVELLACSPAKHGYGGLGTRTLASGFVFPLVQHITRNLCRRMRRTFNPFLSILKLGMSGQGVTSCTLLPAPPSHWAAASARLLPCIKRWTHQ